MHLNQSNNVRGVVPILSRIDLPILLALIILCGIGLAVQFSAGGEDIDQVWRQTIRISIAVLFMVGLTAMSLETLRKYTPHLYSGGFLLLVLVLIIGTVGRGAQRWLDLGVISFQPAELMKIAVPMMVAWLLTRSQMFNRKLSFVVCGFLVLFPGTAGLHAAGFWDSYSHCICRRIRNFFGRSLVALDYFDRSCHPDFLSANLATVA